MMNSCASPVLMNCTAKFPVSPPTHAAIRLKRRYVMKPSFFEVRTMAKSCSLKQKAVIPNSTTMTAIFTLVARGTSRCPKRVICPYSLPSVTLSSSVHPQFSFPYCSFLEGSYSLAETFHPFGNFLAAEKQQHDQRDNQYLLHAEINNKKFILLNI